MRTSMEADAAQSKAAAACSSRGASAHLTAVDLRGQTKTPPRSLDNGTHLALGSRMDSPSNKAASKHKNPRAVPLESRMDSPSINAACNSGGTRVYPRTPITTTSLASLNSWGAGGVDPLRSATTREPLIATTSFLSWAIRGGAGGWYTSQEMPKSSSPDYWDTTTSPTCPATCHTEEDHPGLPWGACRGLLRVAETQKKNIRASRGGRAE